MLGGHSSHSYQTGTNMYFVYDYNVLDCTIEEEREKYYIPLNAIFVEEALKAGGSMCHHHGIGKYARGRRGARHGLPADARAQERVRPQRHHEPRHDLSRRGRLRLHSGISHEVTD